MDIDKFDLYGSSQRTEPPISVIVSTYNRSRREGGCESLLQRAVYSILNQSFPHFELILIDDCSTDHTKVWCQEIASKDPRVQFYHFKKNSGVPAKRYNFGISVSRGKYIAFMFDDDEWELNALQDLYQAIETRHRNCGMVYGLATFHLGSTVTILGGKYGWGKIDSTNFISNNAVLVKRSAIDLVGGYDEDPVFLRICDWDLWWRISRKFKIGRIKKKVAIVYSSLPDSIGVTKPLNWHACRARQRSSRVLPLQVGQKEQFRSRIRSALFDIYVRIVFWYRFKISARKAAKAMLPYPVYQLLKKTKNVIHAAFSSHV